MKLSMNAQLIESLRHKLKRRINQLHANTNDPVVFRLNLRIFWHFLMSKETLLSILENLHRRNPTCKEEVEQMIISRSSFNPGTAFDPKHEEHYAALSLSFIERYLNEQLHPNTNLLNHFISPCLTSKTNLNLEAKIEVFYKALVEPLYHYIDENLDEVKILLDQLIRYKHDCEWFRREKLLGLWKKNTTRGEKNLALDLYRYLYHQGMEFSIEPSSASGSADIVSSQVGEERLIADVKIFCPEKSKAVSYISHGFNQIYIYTQDYNESFGYLVIFKIASNDLRFSLTGVSQNVPYVVHNNKTIFLVTIDIFCHQSTASRRGKLKTYEITESNLIERISE